MKPTDGALDDTVLPESATVGDTLSEHGTLPPPPTTYKLGELLGRGGMGEVVRASDVRIGRDIAIKRMRSANPSPDAIARFLREAKIQARLDHPAIVPVHELGNDPDGRPYFTMKRLTGTTLADVLANRSETQQRLLRAFVDVCRAIEFAHAKGVIHRDLKPANIMLGDYGEVYVLDWGVARLFATGVAGDRGGERDRESLPEIESLAGETQAGAVLGTPGYMSPEQVRGEAITPATDIYALGSILFEILAGAAVHPAGQMALVSTLARPIESLAKQFPGKAIAPELDKLCSAALAFEAADRPTAKELAARLQGYLDGDRDLAARRTLAAELLAKAREALDSNDPARRGEAVHEAGRALSLDPQSEAAALLTQLVVEPPKQLPAELVADLAELDNLQVAEQSRLAAKSMASFALVLPFTLWMGIKDWKLLGLAFGLVALNVTFAHLASLRKRPGPVWIVLITNGAMMLTFGRAFGPFLFVPGLIVASATALATLPGLLQMPVRVIGGFLIAFLLPIALEIGGVWGSTWEVAGDQFVVTSHVLHFDPVSAIVFLTIGTGVLLIVMPLFARAQAVIQRDSRRTVEIQAWHLRQLLPRKA